MPVMAWAADATTPVDLTQRNATYPTGATVTPDKRRPVVDESVQQKRVTPDVVDKKPAAVGDRRAGVEVSEANEKTVREKEVRTPEKIEPPRSRYDQQRSRYSTASDTKKPPTVTRYQESLTAASATNMARFPALDSATSAKINRFIFRKNGGELADTARKAGVTPAAGGSAPLK